MFDIHNPTRAPRIIYPNADHKELKIQPGQTARNVELAPAVFNMLQERKGDLVVTLQDGSAAPAGAAGLVPRKPLAVRGMFGIGDNIHQRAALRELIKTRDVWLQSCHVNLYHDLIEQGLKVTYLPTKLRAQAKTLERERHLFLKDEPPKNAEHIRIWYYKPEIDKHGSILEAQIASFGLPKIEKPDFSLPIPDGWRDNARKLIRGWAPRKPLMIYRPVVTRKEWDGVMRNPDQGAYYALFKAICDKFFIVSIADLEPGKEWISGAPVATDVQLHKGELDFPTMAALFREAAMVFSPAGFAPILAQAVGVPSVIVYGGRESFRTTERAGAHLAPTLGIDPIVPCDCHSHNHKCKKEIDIPAAKERVREFVEENVSRWSGVADYAEPVTFSPVRANAEMKVSARSHDALLFGTTYLDTEERVRLLTQWVELHSVTGENCDLMIVDSASPRLHDVRMLPLFDKVRIESFPDNIGHLARQGQDGWGRAFTQGLKIAIEDGYDFVIHIEGDSLFRLPISPILTEMSAGNLKVASTMVRGMTTDHPGWVETGLMIFDVAWLKSSGFIDRYNWQERTAHPTPEKVIYDLVKPDLRIMPWRTWRDDRRVLNPQTVQRCNMDWITHCRDARTYDVFLTANKPSREAKEPLPATVAASAPMAVLEAPTGLPDKVSLLAPESVTKLVRLNFGCGDNKLLGWRNMDAEIDITKPLPFEGGSALRVFAEHVVEHVSYYQAIDFFKEVLRVLAPGGVLRVAVPSIERIGSSTDRSYWEFTRRWQDVGPTPQGAMHAILYAHGHKTAWTASLLKWTLIYCGFDVVGEKRPGESDIPDLRGIEGHHKVIGKAWNDIETIVFEAVKGGAPVFVHVDPVSPVDEAKVAIVLGGAEQAYADFDAAVAMCREAGVTYTVIAANDQIAHYAGPITACSLHPDKLGGWLSERRKQGYPEPYAVWAHRQAKDGCVTNTTKDWSGSTGLLGVQVGKMKLNKHRIILAGVPMDVTSGHFVRRQRWGACMTFRPSWQRMERELKTVVRSMSGWTQQLLGAPSVEWLKG